MKKSLGVVLTLVSLLAYAGVPTWMCLQRCRDEYNANMAICEILYGPDSSIADSERLLQCQEISYNIWQNCEEACYTGSGNE